MIILIPLGGIGSRFQEEGYDQPKPLIKVQGKEIIRWVLDSLNYCLKSDKVFIVYNPTLDDFGFKSLIEIYYPHIQLIKLPGETKGPCDTISRSFKKIMKFPNEQLLLCDGDTFYEEDLIKKAKNKKENKIFYFKSLESNPIYSYIKIKKNKVIDIEEKVKISNYASIGAYLFNSVSRAKTEITNLMKKSFTVKEYYISLVYKQLLIDNVSIYSEEIKKFHCLGTPQLVERYTSKIKKRFCFDLDNTLLKRNYSDLDYKKCSPIIKNVDFLNKLYHDGHYIIIYTARRMRTHQGDIKKVKSDIEDLTKRQLKKFKINYDELHFGKPYANLYIDDLSINSFTDLSKSTGFYDFNERIKSRSFNSLRLHNNLITKKSSDLKKIKSEIHYFDSIPKSLKKYFPNVIEIGSDFYKYEFIHGNTLADMFQNKTLSKNNIKLLFKTLTIIHETEAKIDIESDYIYHNYLAKLEKRIKSIRSILNKKNANSFEYLKLKINDYKKKKLGQISIIHGDPIFSNIILSNNKLVFIDPRGLLNQKFTIFGDRFYDFAKVYQSLYGYESIINEYKQDNDYMYEIRSFFESIFANKFGHEQLSYLKFLTSSLVLSLKPFHNKRYHKKFDSLFNEIISN